MLLVMIASVVTILLVVSLFVLVRCFIHNGASMFKRKRFYIPITILTVIILFCFAYVFVGTKNAEKLMLEYLDEKGYSQTEIQSIDVKHSFVNKILSYNEWGILVVFADEPTSRYHFTVKDNAIVKGGMSGTTEKDDFKH